MENPNKRHEVPMKLTDPETKPIPPAPEKPLMPQHPVTIPGKQPIPQKSQHKYHLKRWLCNII